MTSRDETQHCAAHCKFVPTPMGKTVLTPPTAHEALGFEPAKDAEKGAVAGASGNGGRMRIPSNESEDFRFRPATS